MASANENRMIIIGAGKTGTTALTLFCQTPGLVVGIVDINPNAPGLQAARGLNIAVYHDPVEAIRQARPTLVFEVTGVPEVTTAILPEVTKQEATLVSSLVARMIMESLAAQAALVRGKVGGKVAEVAGEITNGTKEMESTLLQIRGIMSQLQMLSLNAGIESAKAGTLGKGFQVIANHMSKVAEEVRVLTQKMEVVNVDIHSIATKVDSISEMLL